MYFILRTSLRLFKFNPVEFSPASAGMTYMWDSSGINQSFHSSNYSLIRFILVRARHPVILMTAVRYSEKRMTGTTMPKTVSSAGVFRFMCSLPSSIRSRVSSMMPGQKWNIFYGSFQQGVNLRLLVTHR